MSSKPLSLRVISVRWARLYDISTFFTTYPITIGLEHTPGTSVRDVEMIAALLRWELCPRLAGDEAAEHRLLTLELAGLVIGVDPVGDFIRVAGLYIASQLNDDTNGMASTWSQSIAYRHSS